MFDLQAPFSPMGDQVEAIKQLYDGYSSGKKFQTLLGVTGSGKTFTMANTIQKLGKKTLILAPNKTLAAQLFAEMKEFFPKNAVEYFVSYYDYYRPEAYVPSSDVYIEKDSAINEEIDKLRHSTTRSILEREDVIVVASVSCIYGIGSPEEYQSQNITLFTNEDYGRDELLKKFVAMQYSRNEVDFSRGTFRIRGEIIELFPSHEDSQVIRLEFFDDLLEEISYVDPLTGKILAKLNKITIYPFSHYVVSSNRMKKALGTIKVELRERLIQLKEENKLVEHQRLEQRTLLDLEMIDEMGFCSGIENYSRHLTGQKPGSPPPTLVDFFGKDFLLIMDESHMMVPQLRAMYRGDQSRKGTLVDHGFRLPSALDNRPLQFEELKEKFSKVMFVSATPGDYELEQTQGEYVEQIIRPTGLLDPVIEMRDATYQIDDMLVEVKKTIANGFRVLITTLTKKLSEEITKYYESLSIKIKYLHSDIDTLERMKILKELREGKFDVLVGINLLREGLDLPEVALVGILDADKEGFLRSTRSLIQTIGRAARNDQGRVILYAYKSTKSIEEAMMTTAARRKKQDQFNQENGITPKTIIKAITDGVIEVLSKNKKALLGDVDKGFQTSELTISAIDKRMKTLKEKMALAAKALEFETAAKYRDEIKKLKELKLSL
ncbi:excinuclease ABC subunit UvrB [Bacteriovoracaceae bacterium]|nr:excinuclease ABC subunit UvrB [Bacteriovoracaceae bacterium]